MGVPRTHPPKAEVSSQCLFFLAFSAKIRQKSHFGSILGHFFPFQAPIWDRLNYSLFGHCFGGVAPPPIMEGGFRTNRCATIYGCNLTRQVLRGWHPSSSEVSSSLCAFVTGHFWKGGPDPQPRGKTCQKKCVTSPYRHPSEESPRERLMHTLPMTSVRARSTTG